MVRNAKLVGQSIIAYLQQKETYIMPQIVSWIRFQLFLTVFQHCSAALLQTTVLLRYSLELPSKPTPYPVTFEFISLADISNTFKYLLFLKTAFGFLAFFPKIPVLGPTAYGSVKIRSKTQPFLLISPHRYRFKSGGNRGVVTESQGYLKHSNKFTKQIFYKTLC
jgi:hypothetical protein